MSTSKEESIPLPMPKIINRENFEQSLTVTIDDEYKLLQTTRNPGTPPLSTQEIEKIPMADKLAYLLSHKREEHDGGFFATYTDVLVRMAIPPTWQRLEPPVDDELYTAFSLAVQTVWRETVRKTWKPTTVLSDVLWSPCHEAFDAACQSMAPRLDRRASDGGRQLSFLKYCPMYGLPLDKFMEFVHRVGSKLSAEGLRANLTMMKERRKMFEENLQDLSKWVEDAKKRCWECKMLHDHDLQQCSRCHVACYCGKQCQVQAWKKGHKQECGTAKQKYGNWNDSMEVVGAARDGGFAVQREFCNEMDYILALHGQHF